MECQLHCTQYNDRRVQLFVLCTEALCETTDERFESTSATFIQPCNARERHLASDLAA
jgi:hypothetical protein